MHEQGFPLVLCFCLRVQDMDFTRCEILGYDGKGLKDRITLFPGSLKKSL
tara:strand:+ start:130 stop:279 length:150 start_codon:yes stop_codon:yes gene_type:complete